MTIEMIPLISFVIITTFTPGPNNISSASMGVLYGYRRTVNYLVGIATGFFIIMLACAYLASTLLEIVPVAERYLRWVGASYIIWLAVGTLRSSYAFSESDATSKAFTKGLILQLFNPKVAIYGLTLYSTFLVPIAGRLEYLSLSALTFAMTAFAATSAWALFGSAIRQNLRNHAHQKFINTVLSLLLVYTAVDLSGIW